MEEIKLAISMPNHLDYNITVLRKFFCMTFIDENGLSLHTYIASVFGGVTDALVNSPEKAFKSIQYIPNVDCALQFEIQANTKAQACSIENLTDSFFNQPDKISQLWGKCTLLTCPEEVNNALREYYPDLYKTSPDIPYRILEKGIIQISNSNPDRSCIVTKGSFKLDSTYKQNRYVLSCPSPMLDECIDGLEALNWIKIDIELGQSVLENPFLYTISLETDSIFTPDFACYFALPWGIEVMKDSHITVGHRKVYDVIRIMDEETTVIFNEWSVPPESIIGKRIIRILSKSNVFGDIVNTNELSSFGPLSALLHFDNLKSGNRQFFSGLLIAFFLAFCADKTRINDLYNELMKGSSHLEEGICRCRTVCDCITLVAPLLLLISFISIILSPRKALLNIHEARSYEFFLRVLRFIGLITTVSLMTYVFVLWLIIPDIMRLCVSCQLNYLILRDGAIISFSTNIIYIFYCLVILRRKLYKFI